MLARFLIPVLVLTACNGGAVSSDEEAEYAYLGLDGAIARAMDLGFQGFNAADSANIPAQTGEGDETGTMTVSGKVDQGASDNKGMRLDVALDEYQDYIDLDEDEDREIVVTYWTDDGNLPYFDLQLKDIPTGTLSGSFSGFFEMEGDLEGEVELSVQIDGDLQDNGSGGAERAPGTTSVTGTATGPGGGTYDIDITL